MSKKSVLGRGLASLIPEAAAVVEEASSEVGVLRTVPVARIKANHLQPRSQFDPERLDELARSIDEQGLLQPLVVSPLAGERYELIAGERRLRACRQLGLREVPVLVREVEEDRRLELALIENIQRDELNAIEMAKAFQQLQEQFGHSHEEVAKKVGKDRSTVTNHLRLLNLPEEAQQAVIDGIITMGHARCIVGLKTEAEMGEALQKIVAGGLTVRQAEQLVKDKKAGPSAKGKARSVELPAEWVDVGRRLEKSYSTRVKLTKRGKGGMIQLDFGSVDELNRILDKMLG